MAGGIYNPFGFGGGEVPQPVPRRMPQDIPAAPFGFAPPPSKWDQVKQALWETNLNAPIRGYYNLRNADPYTLYTDTGAAGQQAAMDSFDAAGGVTVGSLPIPKPANSLTMGIKAYHGSPHSFDQFSMDKIGTGEGAQAYGHGLYFAENEGVAKGYKNNLSYKHLKDRFLDELPQDAEFADVEDLMANGYFTPDQTRLLTELKNNDWLGFDYPSQAITAAVRGKLDNYDPTPELQDAAQKIGSMYEVNIDADPNAFLDWDKPLSEQPEAVQKAIFDTYKVKGWKGDTVPLREVMQQYEAGSLDPMKAVEPYLGKASGHQAYSALSDQMGAIDWPIDADATMRGKFRENASAKTANVLKEAGIPGIKYLDAGSRVPSAMAKKELADWQAQLPLAEKELADATARGDKWLISRKQAEVQRVKDGIARVSKEADGTRNYVVFDDKLISIVKKYGIAGASAMLGYNLLEGINPAQADELKRIEAGK